MANPALATAPSESISLKLLVVGDVGVGKTTLIRRLVHNSFEYNYKATIGIDFLPKITEWKGRKVCVQLYDIAGQERFGNMTRVYYREAVGAFIVYDKSSQKTFEAIDKWKSDIECKIQLPNAKALPVVLLANKCDLPQDSFFKVEKEPEGFAGVFDTSAKEAIGFNEALHHMIDMIFASYPERFSKPEVKKAVTLSNSEPKPKEPCSC